MLRKKGRKEINVFLQKTENNGFTGIKCKTRIRQDFLRLDISILARTTYLDIYKL